MEMERKAERIKAAERMSYVLNAVQGVQVSSDIDAVVNQCDICTAGEFMYGFWQKEDFIGVYVLFNMTKDKRFVARSMKVLDSVASVFRGEGNADVYADYKYGDRFCVMLIPLSASGQSNLGNLYRKVVHKYRAYVSAMGYKGMDPVE